MRAAIATILSFALAVNGTAQQTGQNTISKENKNPITVNTQLVVETVVVTDKKGNPISNLAMNDFSIAEDGVPQQIAFFEHQSLPQTPNAAPITPSEAGNVTLYHKLARTQISVQPSGNVRYKDRRLLALYFDMTAMGSAEQMRALGAAKKFVQVQMSSADLVAILRYTGGSVDVLQDFTADRPRLLSILETLSVGEDQAWQESADDASTFDIGAAFGQDDSEFNTFNNDRQLAALQTTAKMLAHLNEKKSLIYFAGGLRLHGLDNQAQLHATIADAIRAGVSFWPVDARGLVAEAPLGDATEGSQGNVGMYTGAAALAVTDSLQQSQDTLYALAADTGGKALVDYNDLTKGIVQAQQSTTSYYILGYYTSNAAQDGRFRRVKIALTINLAANLDYRQGYYAAKQFGKFTSADKERQLEDALMLDDPITELTIAMEIDYFQLNRAEYFVPIVVKIPGRELALAKHGGAQHTLLDFIGEVKNEYGTTVSNMRDKIDVKIGETTALELAKRPIEYDTGFTLLPGKYAIKFLARDAETGRIGAYQTNFVIPNLNKEEKRIPISSVVLSAQRIDLADVLFNASSRRGQDKVDTVDPLVKNGQKLVPSVTRVFSKGREMYVYLQAYQQAAAAAHPLIAFVGFYRKQMKVLETGPIEVRGSSNDRLKTIPMTLVITLEQLALGEYDCQVTILDPSEQKSAFWRAPVKLVQ